MLVCLFGLLVKEKNNKNHVFSTTKAGRNDLNQASDYDFSLLRKIVSVQAKNRKSMVMQLLFLQKLYPTKSAIIQEI